MSFNNVNEFMATINQLISEIAHSLKQPNSVPVRQAIKLGIIHARNEAIRRTYTNHNYTDKVLEQRFRVQLINIPDGDINGTEDLNLPIIKRSKNKIPRPVRLTNNLPFHSVRSIGVTNTINIPFIREHVMKNYAALPGMCPTIGYDYINEYLYISSPVEGVINTINAVVIESVFEYPHIIETETIEGKLDINSVSDDDEFLLPEDMIGTIKKFILETWNPQVIRETNEVNGINKVQ